MNRVFDFSSARWTRHCDIPEGERRGDLYRTQETIPYIHPNGYAGPGMGLRDSRLQEGYNPVKIYPESRMTPQEDKDGRIYPPRFDLGPGYVVPEGLAPLLPGSPPPIIPELPARGGWRTVCRRAPVAAAAAIACLADIVAGQRQRLKPRGERRESRGPAAGTDFEPATARRVAGRGGGAGDAARWARPVAAVAQRQDALTVGGERRGVSPT